MIVFFIVLTILFLLSLFFLLVSLSNLEIEIDRLLFDSNNKKHQKLEDYLVYIRVKLLGEITWLKIKIDNQRMDNIKSSNFLKSKIFDKIDELKSEKGILKKDNIKYIKELNIKLEKINLYMELCTSNSTLTSFAVAIIASIISVILARNIKKYDKNKYSYKINPKYEYKESLKIKLNCIIEIKIVHIMNVIYMLTKKGRVEYDERTSNRRTYASFND